MCLIKISLPKAPRESKENLQLIHELNNDGIGVAFNNNKSLIVQRGFPDFDSFYDYYLAIPADSTILVHFRKCSSGAVIDCNLHPFSVNDNLCFAFNGTISHLDFKDSDKSDTYVFNEIYMQVLLGVDKLLYKRHCFVRLIEKYIGNSKMVLLDNSGEFTIFNENLGYWNNDLGNKTEDKHTWYSNKIWQKTESKKSKKSGGGITKESARAVGQSLLALEDKSGTVNLNLNAHYLGNPNEIKKKYYRTGDPYYLILSLDQIKELSIKHHCGLRKLKKKYHVISELEDVSDQKRLEGYWKHIQDAVKEENENARSIIEKVKDEMINKPENFQNSQSSNSQESLIKQTDIHFPLTTSIGDIFNKSTPNGSPKV